MIKLQEKGLDSLLNCELLKAEVDAEVKGWRRSNMNSKRKW